MKIQVFGFLPKREDEQVNVQRAALLVSCQQTSCFLSGRRSGLVLEYVAVFLWCQRRVCGIDRRCFCVGKHKEARAVSFFLWLPWKRKLLRHPVFACVENTFAGATDMTQVMTS